MRHLFRKITKHGPGSLGVVLPPEVLKSLGWRRNQRVEIKRTVGGILIKDAPTKQRKV